MPRNRPAPKAPFWHRSRLGWVNSLGFAITVFYAGWLLLVLFRTVLPGADALRFTLPVAYVVAIASVLVTHIVFCGMVLSHAWRGGDFRESRAHSHVLLWSVSGIALFLLLALVLVKFGSEPIPNSAGWATGMFWRGCIVGLPAFALMTYVNLTDHATHPDDEMLEEHY